MANLWMDTYQNLNAFQTPYISQNLGIQMISCYMCVTRSKLVSFWNFQSCKRSKKLIIESSQNIFFYGISRNQCGFIYLLPKIVSWAKFEGKLFSDAKFLGPLLQRLPLNVYHEQGSAQLVHVVIDYCYTSGLVVK